MIKDQAKESAIRRRITVLKQCLFVSQKAENCLFSFTARIVTKFRRAIDNDDDDDDYDDDYDDDDDDTLVILSPYEAFQG